MKQRNGAPMRERVVKKPINKVDFAVSEQGAHIRINGFKEFILKPDSVAAMYNQLFPKNAKELSNESV